MKGQVEILLDHCKRKLGYKGQNLSSLIEFYKKYPKLNHVYIPLGSIAEYIKVYNNEMKE